ncbi:MAG: hypothetical protein ACI308_05855 [Muribaculaceae bacterium]
MAGTIPSGPFAMPMMRSFVPFKLQPWLYVFVVLGFQLSGGVYSGASEIWAGSRDMMREDFLMCVYANLGGMAIYFPMLFRMKFRYTNKTLLTWAALVVIACNLLTMVVSFKPLLWLLCFIEGVAKLQGTFECISTIQKWLTPSRRFSQFFPILHVFILLCAQFSSIISTWIVYYMHWSMMHLLVVGWMLAILLLLRVAVRHVRIMPKMKLYGIDWLGGVLWALVFMQLTFVLVYGDFYDWLNSKVITILIGTSVVTLCVAVKRMVAIRHPYYNPMIFGSRHFFPLLGLLAIMHLLMATSRSLEPILLNGQLHYDALTAMQLDWLSVVGIALGLAVCYVWLHLWQRSYYQLLSIAAVTLAIYMFAMNQMMGVAINIEKLYIPVVMRSMSTGIVSAGLMTCLQSHLDFHHFFQGLSVFNAINMYFGGTIGSALLTHMMRCDVADVVARHSGSLDAVAMGSQSTQVVDRLTSFIPDAQMISLTQIYNLGTCACLLLVVALLLCDQGYVRKMTQMLPEWRSVGYRLKRRFSSHERRDVLQ